MNDKYENLKRNLAYSHIPNAGFQTPLNEREYIGFMNWIKNNQIPYDSSPHADYDMAGFWKALSANDPKATTAINPNDNQLHFPDYWKTPYHQTFSNESQWATPDAPAWNEKDQLVSPDGSIVYDERAIVQ